MRFTMRSARILCAGIVLSGVFSMAGSPLSAAAPQAQKKAAPAKGATKSAPALTNPIPMSDNSLKAGRAVYAKICRACHGLLGKGDGIAAPPGSKPANLVDAEWKYGSSDGEIFKTVKEGVKPFDVMEPWGKKIGDNDIWNVMNFLRDLQKRAAATKK